MTVDEAAIVLKSAGCQAEYADNLLVISKIPSWAIYTIAHDFCRDLAKMAMVKHIFTRIDPISYCKEEDNACSFCLHQLTKCPYVGQEQRIPIATMRNGCKFFEAGNVYF
jgi:hypothetical protein